MKKGFWLLLFVSIGCAAFAQVKQTTATGQVWLGYFNQTRLNDKWGIWVDAQLRTKEDLVQDLSQGIARVGLTYYLSDVLKATAGYAYVHHFPSDNHKQVAMPEHRPWQQLQLHTKYNRLRTMQYLRLEERYRRKIANDSTLANGHSFNFRTRYNFLLQYPLSPGEQGKGDISLLLNNELHINFGKEIVYNYFDQNRFFLGAAFHLNAHDNLQLGYLNVFQQLGSGNRYRVIHAARLFYIQNFDLRKKKPAR